MASHGNEHIRTPNLDRLAAESTEFKRFYVCPTCAPTRAGLLTGRYHHRTGIMGVMSGEALIDPDEVTVARTLGAGGYRTGIFGKWHQGDNYPRRPIDMGFDEELVHCGGGLSQPSDPPGVGYHNPAHQEKYNYTIYDNFPHWVSSNNYFDPVLRHNGVLEQFEGYCTDIFFDAAMDFIERHRDAPFFVYLPTNAPHSPEIVSEDYLARYRAMDIDEKTARCYAMIENIDDNIGRLFERLEALGLDEDTILIFLGDNGPQYNRFNSGLRGRKAQFYEGGIRVPFFIRWPGKFEAGAKHDAVAANIDLCPTILSACGLDNPYRRNFDGINLLPLLYSVEKSPPDRTLFFQGNDGVPEKYNQCAVVTQQWKMVNGKELYDLVDDPGETTDLAGTRADIVADLRRRYEQWFDDVGSTRGYTPQRIWIGTKHENPVVLTPQDWRGPRSRFVRPDSHGWWEISVMTDGTYEFTVDIDKRPEPEKLVLTFGDIRMEATVPKGKTNHTFGPMELRKGESRLETWLEKKGEKLGVKRVSAALM